MTADRLRESVAGTPLHLQDGRNLVIQESGGIAHWQPGTTLNDLMRSVDQALFGAEEGGHNRMRIHNLPTTIDYS